MVLKLKEGSGTKMKSEEMKPAPISEQYQHNIHSTKTQQLEDFSKKFNYKTIADRSRAEFFPTSCT